MTTNEEKRRFTDEELEKIIHAVAEGQKIFHENDVRRVMEWITKVRIDNVFANMILAGTLSVDTTGDEFKFKRITIEQQIQEVEG